MPEDNFRGCASGVVASGPAGTSTWGWDTDGSYADWYGGHEIGHTYERKHPGFSTCSDPENPQNRDDDDGDKLIHTLLYSTDGGKTWQPLAVNIKGTRYKVNLSQLPGSDNALFRVIVTDGVNTSMDDTNKTFRVPFKNPKAHIVSPSGKSNFSSAQTVVFNGDAFDLEDGSLDGAALRWYSNKQGFLGSGRSISVSRLKPGIHKINLMLIIKIKKQTFAFPNYYFSFPNRNMV